MSRTDRESPIQIAIVDWLRHVLPRACIVHHCRNEINKRGKNIARELAHAKRKGAVTGFPDIIVLPYYPNRPVFMEVKAEGNYATKSQKEVHEKLRQLGYPVAVVRSIDDARQAIIDAGVGFSQMLDSEVTDV